MVSTHTTQKNLVSPNAKLIELAIRKPALTRVFYLIMDGLDYNKKISEVYYASGRNVRMKKGANPKVIAIHLRQLLDAGLISKSSKEGRIQKYVINWEGVLYALVMTSEDMLSFGVAFRQAQDRYFQVNSQYNGKRVEIMEKVVAFYLDAFVKPYFINRKNELKQPYTTWMGCPVRLSDKEFSKLSDEKKKEYRIPSNFNNATFNLRSELDTLDRLILGPYYYNRTLVDQYLRKKSNQKEHFYHLFDWLKIAHEDIGENSLNQEDSHKVVTEKVLHLLQHGV